MGGEAPDQGEKSVNLWSFAVPEEGNWKLNAIKLYGVYYDGRYYDDETGVSVKLGKEDIHAKIVKTLYVTLSGSNQSFTGYFMDDHTVSDLAVTIEDFENMPIEKATVSDVKVVYYLNGGKVGLDTYGYTADNISSVSIDGAGTPRGTSGTEYAISAMNFRQAGPYENCAVSFALKKGNSTTSFTAGVTAGTELKYQVDGSAASNCPQFDVKWHAPDAKFTATNPAVNKKFDVNKGGSGTNNIQSLANSISDSGHSCELWMKAKKTNLIFFTVVSYTPSKATMQLNDAGNHFSQAKVVFKSGSNQEATYSFTKNGSTNEQTIGKVSGLTKYGHTSRTVFGAATKETIIMTYGQNDYELKLAATVKLSQTH